MKGTQMNEIGNNLGEILQESKHLTTQGKKIKALEAKLKEGVKVLKTFNDSNLAKARQDYDLFLEVFYTGKDLETQKTYTPKKSITDLLHTAWNIYLSRENTLEKMKD